MVDATVFKTEVLSGAYGFESRSEHHSQPKVITHMSTNGKKMKPIDEEIARIDEQIARLQGRREGLLQAKGLMQGQGQAASEPVAEPRKRSPNIKPLILNIMASAGPEGATSALVSARVKEAVPSVAKDTVGSTLSRLKADGALAFDGERYYEARFAPKGDSRPFEPKIVNAF
jgi:hypothetical protein